MSNTKQRASDIRIWILSFLFLFFIVTGGAFLFMYVTNPESTDNTAWYPIAGMVLVAIPWIFWLLTFVYRCCIKVEEGGQAGGPMAFSNKASLGKQAQAGGASGRSGSRASRSESMQGGAPQTTRQVGVEPQEQKATQIGGGGSNNSNESDKPLALSS